MNKGVLKQIKLEILMEAKMAKLKLFYFGYIMRREGSLEKAILEKLEGRRRGRPHMRWTDSIRKS